LRIAFFVQYCHTAGTYFRWHNLAIALKNCGVLVDIYAGDFNYKAKNRVENRDGITYYITPSLISCRLFSNPSDPFSAWRRMLHLPQKKYDVYHLFQPFLQAYKPWDALRKKRTGVFVYDWDDLWTGGLFTKANNWREKYVFGLVKKLEQNIPPKSDGVTVCSSFLKKKITAGIPVDIIYNGFWAKKNQDKQQLRTKWKLGDGTFYIAYIGKTANELSWIKDALDAITNQLNNVKLVIVGPAKEGVGNAGLLNHPLSEYFGEVSSAEAAEIAVAVNLGLLPLEDSAFNQSRFPIKFFDFLAAGTPIYYSGVGEVKNIGKNINGAFEGACTKEEWSNGIINVIKQLMNEPVAVDVANLYLEYSWIAIAQELYNFYGELAKKV